MGGVYCGVCILLRQREVEDAIDVVTTMERIRLQRPSIFASKVWFLVRILTGLLSFSLCDCRTNTGTFMKY